MAEEFAATFRDATEDDMPALEAVLALIPTMPRTPELLRGAIRTHTAPDDGGRFNVMVAVAAEGGGDKGKKDAGKAVIVGAIVVQAVNIVEGRKSRRLGFDFIDGAKPRDEVVIIRGVGVLPPYRRNGVGTELIYSGVRSLAEDDRAQAVLMYAPPDAALEEFMASVNFNKYGVLPGYFETAAGLRPAVVWAIPLRSQELITYVPPAGVALVDLGDPELVKRRERRMPGWLRSLLLHYLLPFFVVGLVFAISYLLVTYGPLQGIGGEEWLAPHGGGRGAAAPTPDPHAHTFDSPDEYDEL